MRPYRAHDITNFVALFGDPDVMRFVGDGKALDESAARSLFARTFEVTASDPLFFIWAVELEGALIGHAELKRRKGKPDHEIVYVLAKAAWGRGLGRKVAAAIVRFAFENASLPHVIATVDRANVASQRILQSLGFTEDEAVRREYCPEGNGYRLNRAEFSSAGTPT